MQTPSFNSVVNFWKVATPQELRIKHQNLHIQYFIILLFQLTVLLHFTTIFEICGVVEQLHFPFRGFAYFHDLLLECLLFRCLLLPHFFPLHFSYYVGVSRNLGVIYVIVQAVKKMVSRVNCTVSSLLISTIKIININLASFFFLHSNAWIACVLMQCARDHVHPCLILYYISLIIITDSVIIPKLILPLHLSYLNIKKFVGIFY